jgi:cobalamin biosynthesis protein CbiD
MSQRSDIVRATPKRPQGEQAISPNQYQQIRQAVRELTSVRR